MRSVHHHLLPLPPPPPSSALPLPPPSSSAYSGLLAYIVPAENVLLYSEEIGQPEPSPRTLQKSPATPAATDGSALPLAIDEALNASEVPCMHAIHY